MFICCHSFLWGSESAHGFYCLFNLYLYFRWWSNYQRIVIIWTGLRPPLILCLSKPRPEFPTLCHDLFVFNCLSFEVASSFWWYWWNCWLLIFKLFIAFHLSYCKIHIYYDIQQTWNSWTANLCIITWEPKIFFRHPHNSKISKYVEI